MNIPTDEQFFSKTEKGMPDIAYLKNHFYREGRLKEEHALYIIEKATEILHTEPNLLYVDAPVTGQFFHIPSPHDHGLRFPCFSILMADRVLLSQSAAIFMANMYALGCYHSLHPDH